jgi:hypothetical protein
VTFRLSDGAPLLTAIRCPEHDLAPVASLDALPLSQAPGRVCRPTRSGGFMASAQLFAS